MQILSSILKVTKKLCACRIRTLFRTMILKKKEVRAKSKQTVKHLIVSCIEEIVFMMISVNSRPTPHYDIITKEENSECYGN